MQPKLTIGMPMHHDYHGAWFSLQSLRLNEDLSQVELLVIDNDPTYNGSNMLKGNLEGQFGFHNMGARYIPYPDVKGPANAKNRVFAEARGEFVLCMDSHVLLKHGTIAKLIAWYDNHPGCNDLISGPLLYDDMINTSTHFDDVWRGEMWGIWGSAWITPDGRTFSVLNEDNKAVCIELAFGHKVIWDLSQEKEYMGHEHYLQEMGCRRLGTDEDEFEIPGNGCGLISCRKEAWLGFNPEWRGFGGEEMYIHEKFRKAGHKALCLGFLKWLHRFGRPEGVHFPLRRWDKIRNYVLGHNELGMDLEPVYKHFVETNLMPQREWRSVTENPHRFEPVMIAETLPDIYERIQKTKRDLDEHMPTLRQLAALCDSVTEFGKRREATIAFLAGKPKKLVSHSIENEDQTLRQVVDLVKNEVDIHLDTLWSISVPEIEETDLLFIDQTHKYADVTRELLTYAPMVRRFIVIHDMELYGERGEDGGPGLKQAVQGFMQLHPEWKFYFYNVNQYGLVVLYKQERDAPPMPFNPLHNGGPGTELTLMMEDLGVVAPPGCDCKKRAKMMDLWGVEGCKKKRDEIVQWIEDSKTRWGWSDKIEYAATKETEIPAKKSIFDKASIIWKTITTGLVFKINPFDQVGSMVDECIRRAEVKERGEV
jgi:glycosyltransferase involved in cell wall biosynthesis